MQEVDAERRIQLLRGERPPTPPPPQPSTSQPEKEDRTHYIGGHRKRRRLAGENDTDRDIRFAREDAELALAKREELIHARKSKNDAPLYDDDGHINLFQKDSSSKRIEKNTEAEKEAADKQRSYEDQYTMRFSNAAGFRQSVGKSPWYSSSHGASIAPESIPSKDVWGNEDPMRKEREKARMDLNDPLAAMKKGVRQLRSVEEERKRWNQERSKELDALKAAEKTQSRHRRKRSKSEDSLENFKLDGSSDRVHKYRDRNRELAGDKSSRLLHRRRSRSTSRSRSHRHHSRRQSHNDRRHNRQSKAEAGSKHRT